MINQIAAVSLPCTNGSVWFRVQVLIAFFSREFMKNEEGKLLVLALVAYLLAVAFLVILRSS